MLFGLDLLNNVMIKTSHYIEDIAYNHWGSHKLEAYIYENILNDSLLALLKENVKSVLKTSTNTFLTHNTIFTINGQTRKIVSHKQNAREQQVVFDLTFHPEWYYQTVDTIKDWAMNELYTSINPIFYKFIKTMQDLEPLKSNVDSYVPIRQHINVLRPDLYLGIHRDSSNIHFKTKSGVLARLYSLTFYLEDHIENCGGELYTLGGFVYKPKLNSAVLFNGHQVLHGVTQNKNAETRLAFTIRFAHKDDLFLPGHPNRHLYKMDHL